MWKKPEYSKKQINDAGHKIIDDSITDEERKQALTIIDNWRAAHAYPMHTFAINLKRQVANIEGAVVVQRLKRLETICGKLRRFPDMQLHRVQDLGGCRVIVPSVEDVYRVKNQLESSRIRHERKNPKDYIETPNPNTGYRGVHLIYKYKSEKTTDFNGLLVEIQIRTKLQHLWATAVETVGVFTGNGLKFNQGSEKWIELFKLLSALFAIREGTPLPEGVPNNIFDLIGEIISINEELGAIDKMQTIGVASEAIGHVKKKVEGGYYLLVLDLDNNRIHVKHFPGAEKGLDEATKVYNELEQSKGDRDIDAVLVAAQSYEALVDAYPNYFADISEFIDTMLSIIRDEIDDLRERNLEMQTAVD